MKKRIMFFLVQLMLLTGCAGSLPALKTADNVDLNRFMGRWYVIACIPTFIERRPIMKLRVTSFLPTAASTRS